MALSLHSLYLTIIFHLVSFVSLYFHGALQFDSDLDTVKCAVLFGLITL